MIAPPPKFIMNPTMNLNNGLLNECENNTLFFALKVHKNYSIYTLRTSVNFFLVNIFLIIFVHLKSSLHGRGNLHICAPNKEDQIDQENWIKHICLKNTANKQNP